MVSLRHIKVIPGVIFPVFLGMKVRSRRLYHMYLMQLWVSFVPLLENEHHAGPDNCLQMAAISAGTRAAIVLLLSLELSREKKM